MFMNPLCTARVLLNGNIRFSVISFFFNFILFFKLYIIVLVLPNIKMNPPVLYFSTERTERQFCLSSGMIDQINSVCLAVDSLKVL